MSTNIEQIAIEKLRVLSPEQQQEVLNFIEQLQLQAARPKTIWEAIREITKDVPDEEWERLPRDGAANLDHYL